MKKLAGLLFLFTSIISFAYDFEVDGIYYNITGYEPYTVEVTSRREMSSDYSTSEYSGAISIPSSITYLGTTFSVTSIKERAFQKSTITSIELPNTITTILLSLLFNLYKDS